MTNDLTAHSENCPSCGQAFTGKFCAFCGEKKVSHHDFTLPHFIEESVEGFTHFDNTFFRSVKLLLLRPGALTANFAIGRRVRYMKPMQIFIVCNLLYFLVVAGTNIFSVPLQNFLAVKSGLLNFRGYFFNRFGANLDLPHLSALFSEKMANQSKAFVVLFIPFYALAGALLFVDKKRPLGLHLVFATHFFSFLLLFFTLFRFAVELPRHYLMHISDDGFNGFAVAFNFAALVAYFTLAAHRFYRVSWVRSCFSGLLAGFLFVTLLQAYRVFLFYKIVSSMH